MVRTFDVSRPRPAERFVAPGHLGYAYSSAFTPDGKSLATGGIDKMVRLWEVNGTGPRAGKPLKGEDVPVYSVAYSPDGKFLAAAGQSTKVRQWEAATLKVRTSLVRHTSYVYQVAYSPDARYVMTQSLKEVLLSEPGSGSIHQALSGHTANIHSASFSPDGQSVATTSGEYERDDKGRYLIKGGKYVPKDCSLRVFDVESGRERLKWSKYEHAPAHVAWRIDRPELLVVEYPYQVVPVEVGEKELKPGKAWEPLGVRTVLTPDGRYAYTQAHATVTKIDVRTGKPASKWTMPEQVAHLTLASDGRHLAVGLETGVVYIMRTEAPRTLTGTK
jgi:WD40 repeat protein